MSATLNIQGLCSTCKDASTCMYQKTGKQPIWDCDGFYTDVGPSVEVPMKTKASLSSEAKSSTTKGNTIAALYKGLCIDCNQRKTCTLSNSSGGVWHCEEYE